MANGLCASRKAHRSAIGLLFAAPCALAATAFNCTSGNSTQWSASKKLWCYQHWEEQVKFIEQDCSADFQGWEDKWTDEKKRWCCEHVERGCPDAPATTPAPYDCSEGYFTWALAWNSSQREWCCFNTGKGCPEGDNATSAGIASEKRTKSSDQQHHVGRSRGSNHLADSGGVDGLKQKADNDSANNEQKDADTGAKGSSQNAGGELQGSSSESQGDEGGKQTFDCMSEASEWQTWSVAKRAWCCAKAQVGCDEQDQMSTPFDCTAGFNNWEAGWSEEKKDWCCTHEKRGCRASLPYDCNAGFNNWRQGWSEAKKDWCCEFQAVACRELATTTVGPDTTKSSAGAEETATTLSATSSANTKKTATTTTSRSTRTIRTSRPYDCDEDVGRWQTAWTVAKKAWCCLHTAIGCPVATTTTATATTTLTTSTSATHSGNVSAHASSTASASKLAGACREICKYEGVAASCEFRIRFAAAHKFRRSKHACTDALRSVQEMCPACSICDLAAVNCTDADVVPISEGMDLIESTLTNPDTSTTSTLMLEELEPSMASTGTTRPSRTTGKARTSESDEIPNATDSRAERSSTASRPSSTGTSTSKQATMANNKSTQRPTSTTTMAYNKSTWTSSTTTAVSNKSTRGPTSTTSIMASNKSVWATSTTSLGNDKSTLRSTSTTTTMDNNKSTWRPTSSSTDASATRSTSTSSPQQLENATNESAASGPGEEALSDNGISNATGANLTITDSTTPTLGGVPQVGFDENTTTASDGNFTSNTSNTSNTRDDGMMNIGNMTSTTAELNFDCAAGYAHWELGWSILKKRWCCERWTIACGEYDEPHESTTRHSEIRVPYNCTAGIKHWETGWSEGKKSWCCQNEGAGCPITTTSWTYNCSASLANWQMEWADAKKEWCCIHKSLGCPQQVASVPLMEQKQLQSGPIRQPGGPGPAAKHLEQHRIAGSGRLATLLVVGGLAFILAIAITRQYAGTRSDRAAAASYVELHRPAGDTRALIADASEDPASTLGCDSDRDACHSDSDDFWVPSESWASETTLWSVARQLAASRQVAGSRGLLPARECPRRDYSAIDAVESL